MQKSALVFYDETFPYAGDRPHPAVVEALKKGFVVVDADRLVDELGCGEYDCLVHLHGPYFPKYAWPEIQSFLKRGGGLIHIGGAPLKHPVYASEEEWVSECEQTAYHQELGIMEALVVQADRIERLVGNADIPLFVGHESLLTIRPTRGFVIRGATVHDHPEQVGTAGPMDLHIHPLLTGVSAEGQDVAAPAVLIENTKGSFAGGRWIFVNQEVDDAFWEKGPDALSQWARFCSRGVTEIWMKFNYASYEPGETPVLSVQAQCIGQTRDSRWSLAMTVVQETDSGQKTLEHDLTIEATSHLTYAKWILPLTVEPGFYTFTCKSVSDAGEVRIFRQGFWGFDAGLLKGGEPLECDRDYFRKAGKPMPVVGMTYMTSDVARKYLFLPNPARWDRDMADMRSLGVNLIRTGIWTAWRHVMFVDGHPSEEVLRALDAFILTARKNDLEVTFTFFAFTPEMWEGINPYLDPRSLEAQKRFVAAIVTRHARTTNVHWDLINEPSLFDPKRPFKGPQSGGDRYEAEAFAAWIQERHGTIRALQEQWNMTPDELPDFSAVRVPWPEDINFDIQDMSKGKRGTRWLDYTLFTMEMHNRWARGLASVIKSIAPSHLVTVGQDEGLAGQRPSPFFYAEAVDYTSVHTWWKMDELVWDGSFAKDGSKPLLVQETGIMYIETPDGLAKRTEQELHHILERKYAYAFSTGGAGAIHWIWNTNFYVDNVNESNIGAVRADGTKKPEVDVTRHFGAFMNHISNLFESRRHEDIAVVFPYSNDFSNRKLAFDATTKLCRVLNYELRMPFRGVSEYHLDDLEQHPPKMIVVPSAHNFSSEAFARLVSHVEQHGGTLLFTGPVSLDEYWRYEPRLQSLIGRTRVGNVVREEMLELDGALYSVSFGRSRIAELVKEFKEDSRQTCEVYEYELGNGRFVWCPLPVELGDHSGPIVALYRTVASRAGVTTELNWLQGGDLPGVYGRKLAFRSGALFIFVSECSADVPLVVFDPGTGSTYKFDLERERTVMFAADVDGKVTSVYRPLEIAIQALHDSEYRTVE